MLLLRIGVAVGGLTFLATGAGIVFNDTCRSVIWGSRGGNGIGNFTATCYDVIADGGMSQGVAGLIAITTGVLILVIVLLPALRQFVHRRSLKS